MAPGSRSPSSHALCARSSGWAQHVAGARVTSVSRAGDTHGRLTGSSDSAA